MVVESKTIAIGANGQVTVAAPEKYAVVLRRLDNNTVRVDLISDEDLVPLTGAKGGVEFPKDVREFAINHGIVAYVERAVNAVQEVFAGFGQVTVSLKKMSTASCT